MGAAEHDSRIRDFFRRVWNERDYAAAGGCTQIRSVTRLRRR